MSLMQSEIHNIIVNSLYMRESMCNILARLASQVINEQSDNSSIL